MDMYHTPLSQPKGKIIEGGGGKHPPPLQSIVDKNNPIRKGLMYVFEHITVYYIEVLLKGL